MAKILVVDDVKELAEVMSDLFAALGHDTRIAHDGRGAAELALTFRPAIIFMDLDMPVLDGYGAATLIRSSAAHGVHLVAVTASAHADVAQLVKAAGFDHLLFKPADVDRMLALIAVADGAVGV